MRPGLGAGSIPGRRKVWLPPGEQVAGRIIRGEAVKNKTLNSTVGFASLLLILLPAALALLYIRAFGVSVIFSDAWSMARIFDEWSSGTLSLSDFFAQHNEHRMFFPKGVEFLLGRITGYDNVIEMYLIQVCFLVTLAVLFLAFRAGTNDAWLFFFVPISFLVFSFRQYENMLFGFQINFAFTQTFGMLTLFLLYAVGRGRFGKGAFVAALGSATVDSFKKGVLNQKLGQQKSNRG